MSLKGRLRGLDARVHWLETDGAFLRLKNRIKLLEWAQIFAGRVATDPAWAEKTKKESPAFFALMWHLSAGVRKPAPPPSPPSSPPPPVAPERPPPVVVAEAPAAKVEAPPTIIVAETPPPKGETPPPTSVDVFPFVPSREIAARPPPVSRPRPPPPSPDLEYRPVHWRKRGAPDDDEEDAPGTNGRCIVEYDVLREAYDDEDDDG